MLIILQEAIVLISDKTQSRCSRCRRRESAMKRWHRPGAMTSATVARRVWRRIAHCITRTLHNSTLHLVSKLTSKAHEKILVINWAYNLISWNLYISYPIGDTTARRFTHEAIFLISHIFFIPAKARDYVFTGVGLSVCLFVCLFVCYHDN